jgi:hypothetical protein
MPNLEADRELVELLNGNGHPREARTVREWRDAGMFAPRKAPGAGRGRRRSTISDADRRTALALAEALDSRPGRVSLNEAAVAAWGNGAPVYHGHPSRHREGLRGALMAEMTGLLVETARLSGLYTEGSRKARSAVLSAGPGETVTAAILAMASDATTAPVRVETPAQVGQGLGLLPALTETGLLAVNPHDPHGLPQAVPALAKFFEGPAHLAVIIEGLKSQQRSALDNARSLSEQSCKSFLAPGLAELMPVNEKAPGWGIGIFAVVLLALDGACPGTMNLLRACLPNLPGSSSLSSTWGAVQPRSLPRGRPRGQ